MLFANTCCPWLLLLGRLIKHVDNVAYMAHALYVFAYFDFYALVSDREIKMEFSHLNLKPKPTELFTLSVRSCD